MAQSEYKFNPRIIRSWGTSDGVSALITTNSDTDLRAITKYFEKRISQSELAEDEKENVYLRTWANKGSVQIVLGTYHHSQTVGDERYRKLVDSIAVGFLDIIDNKAEASLENEILELENRLKELGQNSSKK